MKHVAIVDDEHHVAIGLEHHLAATGAAATVVSFDRPRRLAAHEGRTQFTHAIVDLSFGRWDCDSDDLFVPEYELGIDAIDILCFEHPAARVAVMTQLDTALLCEMAIAIREVWPEISFLHKADRRVMERAARFVIEDRARDNAEVALFLEGTPHRQTTELLTAFRAMRSSPASVAVCLELAKWVDRPTHDDVSCLLPYSTNYVRKVVHETASMLQHGGWIRGDGDAGLERLWLWCRARRPILDRHLGAAVA